MTPESEFSNEGVTWLIEQLEHESAPISIQAIGVLKFCQLAADVMASANDVFLDTDELFRLGRIIDDLLAKATTTAADLELALPGFESPLYERLSKAIAHAFNPAKSLAGKIAILRENKFVSKADYIRLVVAEYGFLMPEILTPSKIRTLLKSHGIHVATKNIRDVVSRIDHLKNKANPHQRHRPPSKSSPSE